MTSTDNGSVDARLKQTMRSDTNALSEFLKKQYRVTVQDTIYVAVQVFDGKTGTAVHGTDFAEKMKALTDPPTQPAQSIPQPTMKRGTNKKRSQKGRNARVADAKLVGESNRIVFVVQPFVCNYFVAGETRNFVFALGIVVRNVNTGVFEYVDPMCFVPQAGAYFSVWMSGGTANGDPRFDMHAANPDAMDSKMAYLDHKFTKPAFDAQFPNFQAFFASQQTKPHDVDWFSKGIAPWRAFLLELADRRDASQKRSAVELAALRKQLAEFVFENDSDTIALNQNPDIPIRHIGNTWEVLRYMASRYPDVCYCVSPERDAPYCIIFDVDVDIDHPIVQGNPLTGMVSLVLDFHFNLGTGEYEFSTTTSTQDWSRVAYVPLAKRVPLQRVRVGSEIARSAPFVRALGECTKRMFVSPVLINNMDVAGRPTTGHATAIVFDKKLRTAQFFDSNYGTRIEPLAHAILATFFPDYSVISFDPGCPTNKSFFPQEYINAYSTNNISPYSNIWTGSCALFALWFIEIRIGNPDVQVEDVASMALAWINEKPDRITNFVRGIHSYFIKRVRGLRPYK